MQPAQASGEQAHVVDLAPLRTGTNTVGVRCPPGAAPCGVQVTGVDLAEADVVPGLGSTVTDPQGAATHCVPIDRDATARGGLALVVTVANAQLLTTVRVNAGPDVLVQDHVWIDGPHPAPQPSRVRIVLDPAWLLPGPNEVYTATAPCIAATCPPPGNVTTLQFVWDDDDDPARCVPQPEVCANGSDDDCNGWADDVNPGLCDGADLDGCRTGRGACANGSVCQETTTLTPNPLAPAPTSLTVRVVAADLVFSSGLRVQDVQWPAGDVDVLAALAAGIDRVVPAEVPAGAALVAVELRLFPSGGIAAWNGASRVVELRSDDSAPGDLLRLEVDGGPLAVQPGQAVRWSAPQGLAPPLAERFFGCPTGGVRWPHRVPVVDVCAGSCGP